MSKSLECRRLGGNRVSKENLELKYSGLPPNVELVGDEEIPCCVVDIMTAEKLIPILTDLVEEKEEENKNLRLKMGQLRNSRKANSASFFETDFKIRFLRDERVLKAVREVVAERKKFEPLTLMDPRNIPRRKTWDSEFGDFYCPNCFEQVKENEEKCPNCHQRLEVDIKKNDDIKDKIKDIRSELLKHGELYKGFLASIRSAIKQYDKDRLEEMRNLTFLPVGFQNDASMRSVPDIEYYILNFLIGDFYCPNCFEPVKRNEEK